MQVGGSERRDGKKEGVLTSFKEKLRELSAQGSVCPIRARIGASEAWSS